MRPATSGHRSRRRAQQRSSNSRRRPLHRRRRSIAALGAAPGVPVCSTGSTGVLLHGNNKPAKKTSRQHQRRLRRSFIGAPANLHCSSGVAPLQPRTALHCNSGDAKSSNAAPMRAAQPPPACCAASPAAASSAQLRPSCCVATPAASSASQHRRRRALRRTHRPHRRAIESQHRQHSSQRRWLRCCIGTQEPGVASPDLAATAPLQRLVAAAREGAQPIAGSVVVGPSERGGKVRWMSCRRDSGGGRG